MQNAKEIFQDNQFSKVVEYERWIDFLCGYGNRLEYQQIEYESKNAMFATMKYRRILRGRDLGNVSFILLNTAYTQKDYIKVHSLLQELFLEPITNGQFEFILNKINGVQNGLQKLYEHHIQDKNVRILSIALIL
ncbi:hypothetical protein ACR77J_07720 [Tissierella praeacuta]|uniref:hypothetical protein n=1 Tax=Tissierella praeacuta TaxID=43131 RepID=UPI003DA5C97C